MQDVENDSPGVASAFTRGVVLLGTSFDLYMKMKLELVCMYEEGGLWGVLPVFIVCLSHSL